jgi:cell division protein FtsN
VNSTMKSQQRGGTIIGFIAGVLVGLASALAVAVYVTRVPVPFVTKAPARTPQQEAAEQSRHQSWDPNAPLQGKPAPPRATASVPAPAPGPAAATSAPRAPAVVASAPRTGSSAPAAAARTAPASDPLGALAQARSAAGTAEPFSYFVQTGAYRSQEEAEAQRAKLTLEGVDAKITEREQSGRTVYRVRVGPIERKEDADRAKEKLEAAGYEAALVRVQR